MERKPGIVGAINYISNRVAWRARRFLDEDMGKYTKPQRVTVSDALDHDYRPFFTLPFVVTAAAIEVLACLTASVTGGRR